MDLAQIWNDAINNVVLTKDDPNEKTIIQIFCAQVNLAFDGKKIKFLCNSMYIYGLFMPYSTIFYEEVKHLIGRNDVGFSLEVGSPSQLDDSDDEKELEVKDSKEKTKSVKTQSKSNSKKSQVSADDTKSEEVSTSARSKDKKETLNNVDIDSKKAQVEDFGKSQIQDSQTPSIFNGFSYAQNYGFDSYSFGGFNFTSMFSDVSESKKEDKKEDKKVKSIVPEINDAPSLFSSEENKPFSRKTDELPPSLLGGSEDTNAFGPIPDTSIIKPAEARPNFKSEVKTSFESKDTSNIKLPKFMKRNAINPSKTFDNYITDPENKILFATAVAVAANPGTTSYNPFYIYGASGLGKTHLLFAIANRIRETRPDIKILYTRAEEFIRHYVDSMATKKTFDDQQIHFQDLYTAHDVFIVDDIQNFARATKTRDTFFDIIAEFIDKPGRQLILASDVPPGNLTGFSPRLTTRFGSGVCCEVIPPCVETRTAITMKKCKEINVNLSDEIIEYISNNIRSNVREIEGAIKTLNTHIQAYGSISLDDAKKILSSLVNSTNQQCTVDSIKDRVSKEYEVDVKAMESADKKKAVSLARSVAMCLIRDLIPETSLSDIGRAFNKDHSSVHEAIKRTKKKLENDKELASVYQRLYLALKLD